MSTVPPARWPVVLTASLTVLGAAWSALGPITEGQTSGIALFLTAVWAFFLFRAVETYRREYREFSAPQVAPSPGRGSC